MILSEVEGCISESRERNVAISLRDDGWRVSIAIRVDGIEVVSSRVGEEDDVGRDGITSIVRHLPDHPDRGLLDYSEQGSLHLVRDHSSSNEDRFREGSPAMLVLDSISEDVDNISLQSKLQVLECHTIGYLNNECGEFLRLGSCTSVLQVVRE